MKHIHTSYLTIATDLAKGLALLSLLVFPLLVQAKPHLIHKHWSSDVEAVIKLGKRGGNLSPVNEKFSTADNQEFAAAMDVWNAHHWKDAVELLRKHLKAHPRSPWAGEAELHIGCYYRYTNQLPEAEAQFTKVMNTYPNTDVADKAKKRLGGTYYLEGNYAQASKMYSELSQNKDVSWRHRTYALHWLRHLNRIMATRAASVKLNQCGLRSVALVYKQMNLDTRASQVQDLANKSTKQSSFYQLLTIVHQDFPQAIVVDAKKSGLDNMPLPAIAYLNTEHYVVITAVDKNNVTVHDPYDGVSVLSRQAFFAEWHGEALVLQPTPLAKPLTVTAMKQIHGGCCGNPIPEPNLGNNPNQPSDGSGCSKGNPVYAINLVNLNMMVKDTPIYYTPGEGLPVEFKMTFNSGDADPPSYLGNKWSLNFDTHYILDPSNPDNLGDILIIRPDGRRDTFTRNADNSFTPPPYIYDTLTDNGNGEYTLYIRKERLSYHYNAQQSLAYIEDRWGNHLTFFYDANNKLDYMTDALGQVTDFTLDANNRITQVTDPFDRTAKFTYTPEGNLETVTDMAGNVSRYTYNTDSATSSAFANLTGTYDITSMRTPLGTTTFHYTYPQNDGYVNYPPSSTATGQNYMLDAVDPDGNITEYYWDGYHSFVRLTRGIPKTALDDNFVSLTERLAGHSTIYKSDSSSRIYYIEDEYDNAYPDYSPVMYSLDGKTYVHTSDYTYSGNNVTIKNAEGKTNIYVHDSDGNLTSFTDYNNKITTMDYVDDDLVTITDPDNKITRFDYYTNHALHHVTFDRSSSSNPDIVTTYTYKSYGKVDTVTNAKNKITQYNYDNNGHLLSITGPSTYPLQFTYDGFERVQTVKDSNDQVLATYSYDGLNRVQRTDYPDATYEENIRSCCQLDHYHDRSGGTTYYDYYGSGRLKTVTAPDTGITQYSYDAVGLLQQIKDANNHTTTYTRNTQGWITDETRDDGSDIHYTYDVLGRVIEKKDRDGQLTDYQYDDDSRLQRVDYADGTYVAYTYYDNGDLHTITDSNGTMTLTYDDVNRLASIDGIGTNNTQQFGYDDLFNLTSFSDPRYGSVQYTYDYDKNRLWKLTGPDSKTTEYSYTPDNFEQLAQIKYPNNTEINYQYDTQHRLTDVINQVTGGSSFASYHYDHDYGGLLRSKLTYEDGRNISYQYDANQRLKSADLVDASATSLRSDSYDYDLVGNRTGMTRDGSSLIYHPDDLNQLNWRTAALGSGSQSINLTGTVTDNLSPIQSMTLNGNPVTVNSDGSYSVPVTLSPGENIFKLIATDQANNPSTIIRHVFYGVDTAWVYDERGNVESKQDKLTNQIDTFTHNARNQLTGFTRKVSGTTTQTASYGYDALGWRTSKTVNGTQTNYIYDQKHDILLEQDASHTTVASYVNGPGIDHPISMTRGGQTYYYHFDGLGSVVALTDSSGAVVQRYEYDAYGNITSEQDTGFVNPYTYTSRERDRESGLYYYRARYYDPGIGRFMEEDPIGLLGGINLYTYVGGNPVLFVDPFGLDKTLSTTSGPDGSTTITYSGSDGNPGVVSGSDGVQNTNTSEYTATIDCHCNDGTEVTTTTSQDFYPGLSPTEGNNGTDPVTWLNDVNNQYKEGALCH